MSDSKYTEVSQTGEHQIKGISTTGSDNLSDVYISAVRRVSSKAVEVNTKSTPKESNDQYIEVVRRVSGATISTDRRMTNTRNDLIGNAELGTIEMTRRLSGIGAAIIEGNSTVLLTSLL